jgi:HEAT repeat protein
VITLPQPAGLFVATGLAMLTLFLALASAQLLLRADRRRRARRGGPARRLLFALAAGDQEAADKLVRLPTRTWYAAEPAAVALVGKVRGEARDALLEVFERRGAAAVALRRLRSRSVVRRGTAAELVGSLRQRAAVPALAALLTDPAPEVRMVAARSLGRIGDPSAVGALLDSLVGSRMPQQVVAHSLMRLGQPAVKRLIDALAHDDPQARATVVEVLGLIQAKGAVAALIDVLRQDSVLEVKIRAVRALGRLGTPAALGPLLDAASADQPPVLRTVAAQALGHLGDPVASLRLTVLLSDPVYRVAHNAANALLRLGESGDRVLRSYAARGTGLAAGHAREALAFDALSAQRPEAGSVASSHERT